MKTLLICFLLGANIPGLMCQNGWCKEGYGAYQVGQQWAGPPGTCEMNQCVKLIDGITEVVTNGCPKLRIQGYSTSGSCIITRIDETKRFPDCCPMTSCTRVLNQPSQGQGREDSRNSFSPCNTNCY